MFFIYGISTKLNQLNNKISTNAQINLFPSCKTILIVWFYEQTMQALYRCKLTIKKSAITNCAIKDYEAFDRIEKKSSSWTFNWSR